MELRIAAADDLTAEAVTAIGYERAAVRLEPSLLRAVDARRAAVLAALATAEGVYGVGTGAGARAGVAVSAGEATQHQARLLLARAVGSAPWLPTAEARMLLAVRLRRFLQGQPGVSAALCEAIAARLRSDLVPAVPRTAIGTAGEVIPLAHAFQTLLGTGLVLAPDRSNGGAGGTIAAGEALRAAGLEPYVPGPKEGIALLAGGPAAVGLALGRLRTARRLARLLLLGAAAAVDALRAPLEPYSAAVVTLSGDPLASAVAARLEALLRGSSPGRLRHQAPVSFRVVLPVQVHLERTLARLAEDADRSLAAIDDSPTLVGGRFCSTGAFHDLALSAALDSLAVALAHAAEVSAQRTHRLLDSRWSGLPDQLTATPFGTSTGLIVVHKRALGAVHELRRLAAPSSVGLADTSLGQEDAQTFVFEAAERLRRMEELVTEVVTCELLCVRQSWALRAGAGDPAPSAAGLEELAGALADAVPPVLEDRSLGEDLDHVRAVLDRLEPF